MPIPELDSQTATRSVEAVIAARERLDAAARPTQARLLMLGSVLSLILGTVLALLIARGLPDYEWLSFGFVLAGAAVGFAMVVGAGDGGKLQGVLAAVVAFGTQVFGIYDLLNDTNASKLTQDGNPVVMLNFSQFLSEIGNVPIWDWIWVLAGVLAAFGIAFQSKKSQSSRF